MKDSLARFAVEVLQQKQRREIWKRISVFPSLAEALTQAQEMVTTNTDAEIASVRVRVDPYLIHSRTQ